MIFYKSSIVEFLKGNSQFISLVHDNRTLPGNGLSKWSARQKQKEDSYIVSRDVYLVAIMLIKDYLCMISSTQ